ncbi:MAG: AlpA family phage regulatory protein [Hydrogenophaga sp.]|nr:AlpA family phage regulatory protein [Hydrogenophaga sp.]
MFNQHGSQQVQNSPSNQASKPQRYLRLPDVESLTGLKKSSIYAGMNANPPTFPHCVRLTARAVAWRESDIAAWQAQREQAGAQ